MIVGGGYGNVAAINCANHILKVWPKLGVVVYFWMDSFTSWKLYVDGIEWWV